MKNLYYIAALAAIGLASCTSEEEVRLVPAQQEIGFKAVAGKNTRAAVEGNTLPGNASIYVASAYLLTEGGSYTNYFQPKEYVEFTNSSTTFNSAPAEKYYYPNEGELMDFLAFYAGNGGDKVMPNNTDIFPRGGEGTNHHFTAIKLNYSDDNKLDGATDLMYGNGRSTELSGSTHLEFKHALAWVTVGVNESTGSVLINSITLDNVQWSGTVTVPVSNAHVFGTPLWSNMTTADSKAFPSYKTPIKASENREDATGLLLPPQAQTQITVQYEMTSDPGNVHTKAIPLTANGNWEANKHYAYVLNFNMGEIAFTCSVSEFGTPIKGADIPM